MNKKVIFSFFSGSGFLDLGFETNGFQIEFINEFSSEFMRAYKYSRKKMGLHEPRFGYFNGDINEFLEHKSQELRTYIDILHSEGDLVGFIGGPPCPDFSIAGKNRGRNGDNGKLSKSYVDLIISMQPDFFLFENVKGLWKTARHREFYEELKATLHKAGYVTTDRLTNAIEFGAPQDRDRILLFGIKSSLLSAERSISNFPWNKYRMYNLEEIKGIDWPTITPFAEGSETQCPANIPEQFTVEYWFRKNDVVHHPNAESYFTPRGGLVRMQTVDEGDVAKKSYKRLHRWRYSPTVAYGNNEVHLHPYKARRLSAAEALALQTLPKEFELPKDMTLTDMFKTIGNGVPYILSSGIAKTIFDYLDSVVNEGGNSDEGFDFTPDPKVLIALTHTPMQPLDALCELLDNAIDSFYSAKIQGIVIDNPMVIVKLPSRKQVSSGTGVLRIQDNGPGMTAENAEKAIKAGFSGNNPYDTLGLFGMGFNISTGKLGNVTTFMTARADMSSYIRTTIDLERINSLKNYSLDAEECPKGENEPFSPNAHGTIIEVTDWWPEGNANRGFVQKLIQYGVPKIREEIGRRYATILRRGEIRIIINDAKCEAYEHCIWDDSRFVVRKNGNVPAVIRFNQVVGNAKRCGKCTAILQSDDICCPSCGSTSIRTIEERVVGWVGIQRFDSDTEYGIDLIRNGRAIKIGEKSAFFEFVDEFKRTIKDYPIDSQYGRIVGEIHLDYVPVDFLKQDFQRSSIEWQKAISFIRGTSSLQPTQPGASENTSPVFRLYQAYRRVRQFGRGDMYMGYWDADSRSAKRISRDTEREYYEKFKHKAPGFYDDSEWWKLVESADQPPVEELPECPFCGTQNVKEAEICVGCGEILKGKVCLNEDCRLNIPLSATSCPYCGANQVPVILEPWVCKVCKTKNVATDDTCKVCHNPRGTNHPLSKDELLVHSDKDDALSADALSIRLVDGTMSNAIRLEVYCTHTPMIVPGSNVREPIIIYKEIGSIVIFIDNSHPIFTRCNLSKEQLIASEVAMYIYQERMNLSSYVQHNLSNITWSVLQANWKDAVEIDFDTICREATDLLKEIQIRVKENLADDAEIYFDELSIEEKKLMTNRLIQQGIDLSLIADLKRSGEYITYTPFTFLLKIYQEEPQIFFGGKVWTTSLVTGGEELLGAEIVAQAKAKITDQYGNYLKNLIIFVENGYSDMLTLETARLAIRFLRKDLSV